MPYTAEKPPLAETSDQLRARIPGWGADLDPADRPSVPRERHDLGRPPAPTGTCPSSSPRPRRASARSSTRRLTPVFGTSRTAARACPGRSAGWPTPVQRGPRRALAAAPRGRPGRRLGEPPALLRHPAPRQPGHRDRRALRAPAARPRVAPDAGSHRPGAPGPRPRRRRRSVGGRRRRGGPRRTPGGAGRPPLRAGARSTSSAEQGADDLAEDVGMPVDVGPAWCPGTSAPCCGTASSRCRGCTSRGACRRRGRRRARRPTRRRCAAPAGRSGTRRGRRAARSTTGTSSSSRRRLHPGGERRRQLDHVLEGLGGQHLAEGRPHRRQSTARCRPGCRRRRRRR